MVGVCSDCVVISVIVVSWVIMVITVNNVMP
jgi:hypothetical protein